MQFCCNGFFWSLFWWPLALFGRQKVKVRTAPCRRLSLLCKTDKFAAWTTIYCQTWNKRCVLIEQVEQWESPHAYGFVVSYCVFVCLRCCSCMVCCCRRRCCCARQVAVFFGKNNVCVCIYLLKMMYSFVCLIENAIYFHIFNWKQRIFWDV